MNTTKLTNTFIGLVTSVTAWLGVFLLSMPDWWLLIQDQLSGLLGASAYDKMVRIMGILVILVRFKTTKPLVEKGALK